MRFINETITRGDQVKRKFKIAMVKPLPLSHYSAIIGVGTDWPRNLWTWRASCFPLKKQPSLSLSISLSLESRVLGMHIYLLLANIYTLLTLKRRNQKEKGNKTALHDMKDFVSQIQNLPPFTFLVFTFYRLVVEWLFHQTTTNQNLFLSSCIFFRDKTSCFLRSIGIACDRVYAD